MGRMDSSSATAHKGGRCKNYQLANFFPARAVALGVVFTALEGSGLRVRRDLGDWVKDVGSGKVDKEDMEEVLEILTVN